MTMRPALWVDRVLSARLDQRQAERSRAGISFVETTAGKVRLRSQRADAKRPRLLFAVDGPNAIEHYDKLFEALDDRADVVVFEPPGTGASFPGRSFDFSRQAFVSCCRDVILAVGVRTLVFPCYLGFVALDLANQVPALVPRLIAPQCPRWNNWPQWASIVDRRRLIRTPGVGQLLVAVSRRRTAERWYRASTGTTSIASTFSAVANQAFDFGACFFLASLMQAFEKDTEPPPLPETIPAAVLWGGRDRTHRRSQPNPMIASSALVHFESCGHCPELEAPARFADWLFSWTKET
jgi:pimeloyl-ACP methyl ester carboxylesterase